MSLFKGMLGWPSSGEITVGSLQGAGLAREGRALDKRDPRVDLVLTNHQDRWISQEISAEDTQDSAL